MIETINVLLVYPRPDQQKPWRFGYSLNLLYISSILKLGGFNVTYIDYSTDVYDENEYLDLLREVDLVVFEFDAFPLKRTLNIHHGTHLLSVLKVRYKHIRTIVIGYDCILRRENVALSDYTFQSEWESSIVDVAYSLIRHGTADQVPIKSIANLDWLPFPDRELLSERVERGGNIFTSPNIERSALIQTSRGCVNTCSFCQRKGWGNRFISHSIEYSVREFQSLYKIGYKNIWVTDDNFTFDIRRAKSLLRKIATECAGHSWKIALSSWSRIDKELLDLCRAAGVSIISFGIESVDNQAMKFYKKKTDLSSIGDLFNHANDIGIFCVGNFILGSPMETQETIGASIEFAKSIPIDQVNVKILDYMIGSDLYDSLPSAIRSGERDVFACKANGLCNFTDRELRNFAKTFTDEVSSFHRGRVEQKVRKFGPPYYTKK